MTFLVFVLSWEPIFNLEAPYSSSNPILLYLHNTITIKTMKKKHLHWGHTLHQQPSAILYFNLANNTDWKLAGSCCTLY